MEYKTLAELTGQNVEITVADAVAIAQQLICEPGPLCDARAPYGPLTLDNLAVTANGRVLCLHTALTPTVIEVGLVLQRMLVNSESLPGGLRYTVSRAVHEVEAPPFESTEDFSRALERFEAGDRREQLKSLYERARASSMLDGDVASSNATAPQTPGYAERRTRQQSAAVLRRQLRDADQRFYEAQCSSTPDSRKPGKSGTRRAPIAACMIVGVALVAAGEAVHVGQPARKADQGRPQPTELGVAASSPSNALPERAATAVPVTAPERSTRSAATHRGAVRPGTTANALAGPGRTFTAKAGPSRSVNAPTHASRKAPDDAAKPQHGKARPEGQKSDHGLLRIRFVWNNPFR